MLVHKMNFKYSQYKIFNFGNFPDVDVFYLYVPKCDKNQKLK